MNYTKTVRVENRDGDLFVNNKFTTDEQFISLIKEGLNHHVVFQNGRSFSFIIEEQFGRLVANFPASAPLNLNAFIHIFKNDLMKHGPVSTLHQDDFYLK